MKTTLHLRPATVLLLLLLAACQPAAEDPVATAAEPSGADLEERGDGEDPTEIEAWLDAYYPDSSQPGYNLILYRRRVPTLIDMNGRVVHRWPAARVSGRARLLPDGNLLVISDDAAVRVFTWEGQAVWEFRLAGEDFPHHDLIQLDNGNRLVLAHDVAQRVDYLVEVSGAGEVVWSWHAGDHLQADFLRSGDAPNRTHINSVHELRANRWSDAGDERFRPGNILISARNMNALYLIDKPSGKVVWSYYGELDHQHEALMIPRGHPNEGNILVFNNGLRDLYAYRKSSLLEIDPISGSIVWKYEAPAFFSSTGGTQQSLANGNLLVTSSRGGRVFELTREGRIVWQLSPSYKPMRVERYPYDHTPQLAAMARPAERRVERRNPRRYVDADLYTFALPHQTRQVELDGAKYRVLKESSICRELRLPERPDLVIGYGIKPRRNPTPDRRIQVELAVHLRPRDQGEPRTLLEERVRFDGLADNAPAAEGETSERLRIRLDEYALRAVELCLEALGPGGRPAAPAFFWTPPVIRTAGRRLAEDRTATDPDRQAVEEKHLRALGYID